MAGIFGGGSAASPSSVGPLASGAQYASLLQGASQAPSNFGPLANGNTYGNMLSSDPLTRFLGLGGVSSNVAGTDLGLFGRLSNAFPNQAKPHQMGPSLSMPGFVQGGGMRTQIPQVDLMSFLSSLQR